MPRALPGMLFADSLPDNLEKHYGGCGRDIQRFDMSDHRDGQLFVAEFEHLLRYAALLVSEDYGRRSGEIGIV